MQGAGSIARAASAAPLQTLCCCHGVPQSSLGPRQHVNSLQSCNLDPGPLPPAASPGLLATRDVLSRVASHLDRPSLGALRATCAPCRAAADSVLDAAQPARGATMQQLLALLRRLPSLQELSLASCADGCAPGRCACLELFDATALSYLQVPSYLPAPAAVSRPSLTLTCRVPPHINSALGGHATLAAARPALAPLAAALAALTALTSLSLPLAPCLELGSLAWAAAWSSAAALPPGGAARAALRAAVAGRYEGAYKALECAPHAVLLLPGWLLGPGAAVAAVGIRQLVSLQDAACCVHGCAVHLTVPLPFLQPPLTLGLQFATSQTAMLSQVFESWS